MERLSKWRIDCFVKTHIFILYLLCVFVYFPFQMKSRKYEHCDSSFFEEDVMMGSKTLKVMEWGLNVFLLVWFILGNVWTIGLTGPNGTPPPYLPTLQQPRNWCSKGLFLFSVTHLYLVYGLILVLISLWILSFTFVVLRNLMNKWHKEESADQVSINPHLKTATIGGTRTNYV